ncbi:MAG: TolC family protein [Saprospirales bacterium]|nr:TolC family protein [Saprospirales bacterium]
MKNWIFSVLLLCGNPAMAQIQFNSIKEVLNYADAHAVALKSAVISEQIAVSEKEARSALLPALNLSLGYNDNITLQPTLVPAQIFNPAAPEGAFQELTFGTKYIYSRGLQIQWDALNFKKLFDLRTADFEIEKSRTITEINRFNTYQLLASTYYSILLTQESIKIYEKNIRVAQSIYELAQDKFQRGIISKPELNRAEINAIQNQRTLDLANSNLEKLYIQFQSQLNTKELIVVADSPETFVLLETGIQSRHPEIIMQEAEVRKSESILKQTTALWLPSLSLFYQNNQNWATNDFLDFSNANNLPQQVFGVKLSMAGLLSGSTRQKVSQSKSALQLQQLQLDNLMLLKGKEDESLQIQQRGIQAAGRAKKDIGPSRGK